MAEIQKQRPRGKIGFEEMARVISKRWKQIDPDVLEEYKRRADEEKRRYSVQIEAYQEKERSKIEEAREQLEATVSEKERLAYFGSGGKR